MNLLFFFVNNHLLFFVISSIPLFILVRARARVCVLKIYTKCLIISSLKEKRHATPLSPPFPRSLVKGLGREGSNGLVSGGRVWGGEFPLNLPIAPFHPQIEKGHFPVGCPERECSLIKSFRGIFLGELIFPSCEGIAIVCLYRGNFL